MKPLAKFSGGDLDRSVEFMHPDVWERVEQPDWSRLVIGARGGEVSLLLDLCEELREPFGVLYVLTASRCGRDGGRYQCPEPIDRDQLDLFLNSYRAFFEQDGRHHLWISSGRGDGQLILDRHNVIYAYGDLEAYEARLRARGFEPGTVRIPVPHTHHYHGAFDEAEDEVMQYWDWVGYPLDPDQDD